MSQGAGFAMVCQKGFVAVCVRVYGMLMCVILFWRVMNVAVFLVGDLGKGSFQHAAREA